MKNDKLINEKQLSLNMRLDKKDKQILYELDKNARAPLSTIAKKVNLSRESVLYRINKYKKEKLIRNFLTVIDLSKLGYLHYKGYIKFQNINEKQEREFINSLIKNPLITWIGSCDGKYSLIFAIKSKTVQEVKKELNKINAKFSQYIKEFDFMIIANGKHYSRDYLLDKKPITKKVEWGDSTKQITLDKTNKQILLQLAKDSRVNAADIARQLNISSDAVIQRIKKLTNSGLIENYMIWANVNKLCGLYYKVLVTLKNIDDSKEKVLHEYLEQNKNVVFVIDALGKWNLEIDLEVKDLQQFRNFIRDFNNKFTDIIQDYTALNIYEEHKYTFVEEGFLF